MKVKALVWMGIKTEKFAEMEQFLKGVMGMPLTYHEHDFTLFRLPSGDQVEIFGPNGPDQHFAPDSIVCGFLVEDIHQASQELMQAGIELVGSLCEDRPGGYAWQHFRGPDGKLYELTYDPERS
ncbi:MAG: VOC family protein [Chloroflexi bacterium]|nr:VOC family protein [Chloroflexota bacterium]